MTKRMRILSLAVISLILIVSLAGSASAAAIKGSNVWDRDQSMPSSYTWTPEIYSGLWYDIDKNMQTENIILTISASDRQINAENAEYITEAKSNRFAYSEWGSYRVIGWQGEPYFAGYTKSNGSNSTAQFANSNISTLSGEKIYKVLSDNNTERKITSGGTYNLENGYRIRVDEINESRKEFKLTLEKDGSSVKSEVVSSNSTFVYEKQLGSGNVPVIVIHTKTVSGNEAVIDGVFQISESSTDVNVGKKWDAMEIRNVNDTAIIMKNPNTIKLEAGRVITFMGHMKIDVKNTSALKFEMISDPKTSYENKYPNRGTVYTNSSIKSWNGMNFKGFTYDYQNTTETENLTFEVSGSIPRTLQPGNITYQTNTYNKTFNYSDWGSYQSIKLGGDEYFTGYTKYNSSDKANTTNFTDSDVSLLNSGRVSKILINNNTSRDYSKNSTINLEEGYTLQIEKSSDNNSSKANLILKKNGTIVKETTVAENTNFVYETEVGGTIIPVIAVRILSIFEGTGNEIVKLGGIFQVSTNPVDVGVGKTIENMKIEYTSKNSLVFINKDVVNLSAGKDISLMENLSLHVADSDELRFFLFGGAAPVKSSEALRIEVPETILPYQEIIIKVSYQDGSTWKEISGAAVKVNGEAIGDTNSTGLIRYVMKEPGTYEFRAEKSGYEAAAVTKSTVGTGEELFIDTPSYLFAEDSFYLYVRNKDQKNISGAAVYKNGTHIGTTNDNGLINVTADSTPGIYTLTATLAGYKPASKNMEILEYGPYFAVTQISIPDETYANKTVKIPLEVTNVGKEKATQDVTIKYGEVTEVKKVTLDVGESKEITFNIRPKSAGTETVDIGNQTYTLTVIEKQKAEIPWKWVLLGGGTLIIIIGAIAAVMYYIETKEEEKKTGGRKTQQSEQKAGLFGKSSNSESKDKTKPAKTSSSDSTKSAASNAKKSNKYSSSNKPPELKNSQKKARLQEDKK
jgi:S-layer-related duplication domain